jgi:hypothetical protein
MFFIGHRIVISEIYLGVLSFANAEFLTANRERLRWEANKQ